MRVQSTATISHLHLHIIHVVVTIHAFKQLNLSHYIYKPGVMTTRRFQTKHLSVVTFQGGGAKYVAKFSTERAGPSVQTVKKKLLQCDVNYNLNLKDHKVTR